MPHVFFFLADGRTRTPGISAHADWPSFFRRGCQSGSIASITLFVAPRPSYQSFLSIFFVDAASAHVVSDNTESPK